MYGSTDGWFQCDSLCVAQYPDFLTGKEGVQARAHTSSRSASSGLSCETHLKKVLLPALMLPSTQSVTRFDLPVVLGPPASAISSSTLCLMSVTISLQWWLRIPTVSCSNENSV